MRKAPVFFALSLLAAAGPAAAQAPQAPKPAAAPAEERPATPPASRLNLKLDDAARYTKEEPGKTTADPLPSLGGNPVYAAPPPPVRPDGKFSYPSDWQNGR